MSNNGDLKPEGPPTLFNSQSETDEAGQTRILASLEGRVGAGGKPPKKNGRRYGIVAAVAVLAAGIGAWIVFNPSHEAAPPLVAEQAAPTAPSTPAQPAASAETTLPAAAVATIAADASVPAAPQAATIVNVAPDEGHALDKPGKDAAAEKTTAKTPAHGAYATASAEHGNTAQSENTAQGKAETAKLVEKSAIPAAKDARMTKTKSQPAAKSARNRKGPLAADDPDADLLAALLAPQQSNASKAPNQPTHLGQ